MLSRQSLGFTLAEVLITLGIIGVVAAMTIPTLMNNIGSAEIKSKLKKEHSILSQATMSVASENGGSLQSACAVDDDGVCFGALFKPYFATVDYCPGDGSTRCWHKPNEFFWLGGTPIPQDWSTNVSTMVLKDGSLLAFMGGKSDCSYTPDARHKTDKMCGTIYLDINGFKKPNTLGKDIFTFWFLQNSVVPDGSPVIMNDSYIGNTCPALDCEEACTYYYMFKK